MDLVELKAHDHDFYRHIISVSNGPGGVESFIFLENVPVILLKFLMDLVELKAFVFAECRTVMGILVSNGPGGVESLIRSSSGMLSFLMFLMDLVELKEKHLYVSYVACKLMFLMDLVELKDAPLGMGEGSKRVSNGPGGVESIYL